MKFAERYPDSPTSPVDQFIFSHDTWKRRMPTAHDGSSAVAADSSNKLSAEACRSDANSKHEGFINSPFMPITVQPLALWEGLKDGEELQVSQERFPLVLLKGSWPPVPPPTAGEASAIIGPWD
jgi:hypothetical protein